MGRLFDVVKESVYIIAIIIGLISPFAPTPFNYLFAILAVVLFSMGYTSE